MLINMGTVTHYMGFVAPPFIGAFIGYLTNKVAIRMLFRPLRPWRIFGIRIPMTPGVIPTKRHELALNIGEMVGEHLLTSEEIGKALTKEKFQDHLLGLIKERVGAVLHRDLGPLPSLIPEKFNSYFDVAVRAITYQTRESVHKFIRSEEFSVKVERYIDTKYGRILKNDLNSVLSEEERQVSYQFIEKSLSRMLTSPTMDQWVADFVYAKVHEIIEEEKSLHDILPASSREFLLKTVEDQTPHLLVKLAEILEDQDVRDRIVRAACRWIQDFVGSLGPMAAMVGGFLNMETVESKIHEYLLEKKEDITKWLQNEEVRGRVADVVRERCAQALSVPLVHLLKEDREAKISGTCDKIGAQILAALREKKTAHALSLMIRDNIEAHIQSGAVTLGEILNDLFGTRGKDRFGDWMRQEGLSLLRSKETVATIDSMLETMIGALLEKPVGRLSNILPAGVRDGMYLSIRKMASTMLATEVPGLVHSLNIKMVVTEKVDSLDLLKLERLLLSIMEEQFKYINLFGALLGFLIGCFNLVLL